jgi:hypothetical protein
MNVFRLGRPTWRVRAGGLALCIALLAAFWAASSAQASTEHQFCWGKNLPSGTGCSSANWNMHAAYASGWEAPVCIILTEVGSACEQHSSEGAYVYIPNEGTRYTYATEANLSGTKTKAYGLFWTIP